MATHRVSTETTTRPETATVPPEGHRPSERASAPAEPSEVARAKRAGRETRVAEAVESSKGVMAETIEAAEIVVESIKTMEAVEMVKVMKAGVVNTESQVGIAIIGPTVIIPRIAVPRIPVGINGITIPGIFRRINGQGSILVGGNLRVRIGRRICGRHPLRAQFATAFQNGLDDLGSNPAVLQRDNLSGVRIIGPRRVLDICLDDCDIDFCIHQFQHVQDSG